MLGSTSRASPPGSPWSTRPRATVNPDEGWVVRVVREVGGANYPVLSKTNYNDWSLVMKVMLEARGLWQAYDAGGVSHQNDRNGARGTDLGRPLGDGVHGCCQGDGKGGVGCHQDLARR